MYVETTYSFAAFHSDRPDGLVMGDRSGVYQLSSFIVGPAGKVVIGVSTILNGAYVVCDDLVEIGSHCLISWGVFITDSWPAPGTPVAARRDAVRASSRDSRRLSPSVGGRPVRIENGVWIGFGAVIMPGVTLGEGCVIGSRAVVDTDVPPYAVAVGDPVRIVRFIDLPEGSGRDVTGSLDP